MEAFQSMLNKSIDTGKRKIGSGKRNRMSSGSDSDSLDRGKTSHSSKNGKFEIFTQGNNGSGDHTLVTLSRDTILDVNMQELNCKLFKTLSSFKSHDRTIQ